MRDPAPVSVVIPCWRCSDTIDRALASIAAQTWLPSEVILVDDASGDVTLACLDALAKRYPDGWVRVIALSENGGPGPARNAGWEAARFAYVALLDADDAWHPRKIELQVGWMLSHLDVMLTGHDSRLLGESESMPEVPEIFGWRQASLSAMLVSNRFPTRSVVLKREIPFRFGNREITEDYWLWLQCVSAGFPCVRLDVPLAFSFRPEFSPGGFSGRLWIHEKRELRCLQALRRVGGVSGLMWPLASAWSLLKYVRRAIRVNLGLR